MDWGLGVIIVQKLKLGGFLDISISAFENFVEMSEYLFNCLLLHFSLPFNFSALSARSILLLLISLISSRVSEPEVTFFPHFTVIFSYSFKKSP